MKMYSNDLHHIDSLGLKKFSKNNYINISTFHYPTVWFFKTLGLNPITIASSEDEFGRHKYLYKFSWKTLEFAYSFGAILFVVGMWTLFIVDRVLLIPLPFQIFVKERDTINNLTLDTFIPSPDDEQGIIKIVQTALGLTVPLSIIGHCCNILRTTPELVQYLNNWSFFEESIQKVYPSRNNVFQSLILFWKVIMFGVGVLLIFSAVVLTQSSGLEEMFSQNPSEVITCTPLCVMMAICGVTVVMIGNDLKSILMLRTLEEAFKQVKEIIQQKTSSSARIYLTDVQFWMKLTYVARRQVTLSSKIQGVNLLIDMIGLFVIWCGTAFAFIMIIQTRGIDSVSKISYTGILFLLVLWSRLTSKTFRIESMSKEENGIAQELRDMNVASDDMSVLLEIKMLIDLLETTPSTVNIVNLFTFNRRLIFVIIGQVASYLLVLLQFQANS